MIAVKPAPTGTKGSALNLRVNFSAKDSSMIGGKKTSSYSLEVEGDVASGVGVEMEVDRLTMGTLTRGFVVLFELLNILIVENILEEVGKRSV